MGGPDLVRGTVWLSAKGNELAWRHRPFRSLDEFERTQAAWTNWSCLLDTLTLGFGSFFVVGLVLGYVLIVALSVLPGAVEFVRWFWWPSLRHWFP